MICARHVSDACWKGAWKCESARYSVGVDREKIKRPKAKYSVTPYRGRKQFANDNLPTPINSCLFLIEYCYREKRPRHYDKSNPFRRPGLLDQWGLESPYTAINAHPSENKNETKIIITASLWY